MDETVKIVAHQVDGTLIKGYTRTLVPQPVEDLEPHQAQHPSYKIPVTTADGEKTQLHLSDLKALFVVKSFDGNRDYREVKFFTQEPEIDGLWVRLSFRDNEVLEGIVLNNLDFLLHPGFFLKPPDPLSNNRLVYVVKAALSEFKALGVQRRQTSQASDSSS